jgi:tRNA(fMet)-specific endonuclease VapC
LGSPFAAEEAGGALENEARRKAAAAVKVLLDTDVCIAVINRDDRVRIHLESVPPSQLRMSAITLAELKFGVAKSGQPRRAVANLRMLLGKIAVVPFDEAACERYGELRAHLERRGSPIGPLDTLIAAHALSLRWVLATHNTAEFRRVPGLRVADWLRPPSGEA